MIVLCVLPINYDGMSSDQLTNQSSQEESSVFIPFNHTCPKGDHYRPRICNVQDLTF